MTMTAYTHRGRIYRISYGKTEAAKVDLTKWSNEDLAEASAPPTNGTAAKPASSSNNGPPPDRISPRPPSS